MRSRPRLVPLLGIVGALLASMLAVTPSAAAGPDTWYVAPGEPLAARAVGGSCATPDFSAIQPAIDAAGPGDTIILCDGTYVTDPLVIEGYGKRGITLKAAHKWRATLRDTGFVNAWALLEIQHTREVTVQGLRFAGRASCPGAHVRAAIDATEVKRVVIRGNRIFSPPGAALANCGFDSGIWLSESTGSVRFNLVQDWGYLGILTEGNDDPGRVRITGNSLRYWHQGVTGQTSASGTGIYVHDGDRRQFLIDNNRVIGLSTAGTDETGTTPMLGQGLMLEGRRMLVVANHIEHTETGLFAYQYPAVGVRRNTSIHNRLDCGSDELSSRWVDNVGKRSDPVGLCTPPAN